MIDLDRHVDRAVAAAVNGGTVHRVRRQLMGFDGTQWDDVINLGASTWPMPGINDAGAGNDTLTGTDGANYINGGAATTTISRRGREPTTCWAGAGDDAITFSTSTGGTIDGGQASIRSTSRPTNRSLAAARRDRFHQFVERR